ncbi:hypothetical protein CEXT_357901 [Caerostris extrusa]|uniref:Uncharacterized protein n=1 Tax=Caerostris extrusa TaxID=172846 RepID=A0AAV4XWU0_CAEEX|nr:hypothetical protein CEXT_357901 [Caerostris extrusa]
MIKHSRHNEASAFANTLILPSSKWLCVLQRRNSNYPRKAEEVPYQTETEALVFKTSLQLPHYRRSAVTSIRGNCLLNLLTIFPITAAEFRRKGGGWWKEKKFRFQIRAAIHPPFLNGFPSLQRNRFLCCTTVLIAAL